MHPNLLNNAGVAFILFLQGLTMAVERMKTGASNWRLIFGAKGNLGLILLPIMFYHPFQRFIGGLLANHFSAQNPDIRGGEGSPISQAQSIVRLTQ